MNSNDAIDKIKAGATLIQLYSGFVYSGPSIVKQINEAILDYRLNQ
jgi:dihydroorotate dehydrogenase